MKIKNKGLKIFGTFATTLAICGCLNTSTFADTLTFNKISDTCKYTVVSREGKVDHSNYAYYLDGIRSYTFTPGGTVRTGSYYEQMGSAPEVVSWILFNVHDEELAQAAIWQANGYVVNGNMMEVTDVLGRAYTVIEKQYAEEKYINATGSNFALQATYTYSPEDNMYYSSDIQLGYFEHLTVPNKTTQNIHFEKLEKGQYVDVPSGVAAYDGTFRFAVSADTIKPCDTVSLTYSYGGTYYTPAMLWTSPMSTQDLVQPTASSFRTDVVTLTFSEIPHVKGDINRDRYVNSTDAALVLDLFKNENASQLDYRLADMNSDRQLNASDAAMIIDIFKGV